MHDSTRFADAMALTPVSSDDTVSVFDGLLNAHWTIGQKVHGGAMLALCANAARLGLTGGQERSDSGMDTAGRSEATRGMRTGTAGMGTGGNSRSRCRAASCGRRTPGRCVW
jgi:hypothetical protein